MDMIPASLQSQPRKIKICRSQTFRAGDTVVLSLFIVSNWLGRVGTMPKIMHHLKNKINKLIVQFCASIYFIYFGG